MIQQSTLKFLNELKENNYREWFNEHKARYEAAKANVLEVVGELVKEINRFDSSLGYPDLKKCMFRIYRDTRFSKNKEPYKTNMGTILNAEGNTKSLKSSYYVHVEPGNSFISCGVYMSPPEVLSAVRSAIDEDFETFSAILKNKTFKKLFVDLSRDDDALQRVPKGFDSGSPAAEYLKLKHFYVMYPISNKLLCSDEFVKEAAAAFKAMKPFNDWINKVIEDIE